MKINIDFIYFPNTVVIFVILMYYHFTVGMFLIGGIVRKTAAIV